MRVAKVTDAMRCSPKAQRQSCICPPAWHQSVTFIEVVVSAWSRDLMSSHSRLVQEFMPLQGAGHLMQANLYHLMISVKNGSRTFSLQRVPMSISGAA